MRDWAQIVRQRIAPLELRPEREAEIAQEIAEHLESRCRELLQRGVTERDAENAALAELTDDLVPGLRATERRRAPVSTTTGGGSDRAWLRTFAYDLRHGLRSLVRSPAYSLVSMLTLALAIGACTLAFGVVDAVLLRPLPFANADRLVTFWGTAPEKGLDEVDFPEGLVALVRDRARSLEKFAAFSSRGVTLTGNNQPERIDVGVVTLGFFDVFQAKPFLGRAPVAGEDQPNGEKVMVLSHELWLRRFGGDSAIVGTAIDVSGTLTTVIGVMPRGFDQPNRSTAWVPMTINPSNFDCWCYNLVGRRKPQFSIEDVRRDIATTIDDFGMQRRDVFPEARPGGTRIIAMSLAQRLVGNIERPVLLLLGAALCVLLIACANIANLMLARATARTRELAVRCCLGASPLRVASQLLTESMLLSMGGAILGSLLALWGIAALRQLPPTLIPRIDEIRVDGLVLFFAIGTAIVTGVLCGAAPALRARRLDLNDGLKNGTRGSASRATRRLSNGFVVIQMALSLVLLVNAGLLVRSFQRLSRVETGYNPRDVLVAKIELPYPRFESGASVSAFFSEIETRVGAIPGVQAVGMASQVPLSGGNQQSTMVAEFKEPRPGEPTRVANSRWVTAGYFPAIGTPLRQGRAFSAADTREAARVAVVDEAFAKHFWGTGDALGKRFRFEGDTSARRWLTVVGVVPNIKHNKLDETPDLQMYEAVSQRTPRSSNIVIRSSLPADALIASVRREIAELDATLPLSDIHTMSSAVAKSLGTRKLINGMLSAFAVTALLLAAIGIYGVISIGVNGRVREFGIRLALGAKPGDIERMVLRQGFMLASVGMLGGLVAALAASRLVHGMLYGVQPFDPVTFGGVAVVLTSVALLACLLPARRASRSDPILVLSNE